jgi:polygalacturonase
MNKWIFSLIILITAAWRLPAQEEGVVYKASLFGCMSDGVTLNTSSIQTAINTINGKGGGSLHFYVGRYLTGTIHLKSNVTIVLHEGAVLVGVPSIYDYDSPAADAPRGLIIAAGQSNIGVVGALPETPSISLAVEPEIIGMGVVQGSGAKLRKVIETQQQKGYLERDAAVIPALISFADCDGVTVSGMMMLGAAGDVQSYRNCSRVSVANLLVDSRETPGSSGIAFSSCNGLTVTNSFFDVTGKPIRTAGNSKGIKTARNRTKAGTLPNVSR